MNKTAPIPAHKKPHRWGLITFFLFCVGLFVLGLFALQNRVMIAQWGLSKVATKFDFPDARFTLSRLEKDGLNITNIWLGPDLRIASLKVNYSLLDLMSAKLALVEIKGVDVDITHLDKGAVGKIQKLTQNQPNSPSPATNIPNISLENVTLHGELDNTKLNITLDGHIKPDRSLKLTSRGNISYPLADRFISIKNMLVHVEAAADLSNIKVSLENTLFLDEAPKPWFKPLTITGTGFYSDLATAFTASIQNKTKTFSTTVTGRGNIKPPHLSAKINLSDITFAKDGLQPKDLFPSLQTLPPINTSLKAEIDLSLFRQSPTIKARITSNATNITHQNTNFTMEQAQAFMVWPKGDIQISIPEAFISHDSRKMALNALNATVKIKPNNQDFPFSISNLTLSDTATPALFTPVQINAKGELYEDKVTFKTTAKLLTGLSFIQADGMHDLKAGKGYVNLETPSLTFSKSGLKPSDFTPFLDIFQETHGTVTGKSYITWTPTKLKTNGRLRLSGLSLATDTLSVKGINTDLKLSSLWPPKTQKIQTIHIDEISSGVSLENAQLSFALKGPTLWINEFKAGFLGGNISLQDIPLNPNAQTHHLKLKLNKLDLEQLFKLIELDGLAGTGKMTGALPITLSNDDIMLKDGLLVSDGPGVLQFRSSKAKQALAGAGEQVELLLNVLNNFHYDRLSLSLDREFSHDARVGLHIEGHNPDVMAGRAFNLNINLEGNVDRLLAIVLEGYRLSDRAIRASLK